MYSRLTAEQAATQVEGPLLFLRRTVDVGLNEAVEAQGTDGVVRMGRVAALDEEAVTVEMLDSTAGLSVSDSRAREVASCRSGVTASGDPWMEMVFTRFLRR